VTQHAKELAKLQVAADYFFPKGAFIAGGALNSAFTNTDINDVDIYFKTQDDFIEAVEQAYDDHFWCVSATDRAVTFAKGNGIIQLMHFDFFENATQIFDAFDFTVAMAAYDIDAKQFVFHEDFLKHSSQRFLKFHDGTRYPFGSLLRVLKYQSRGYTIGKSELLRIGLSLGRVKLESWEDLAKAIGGQYGEQALIETDKPFSIDAAIELFGNTEVQFGEKNRTYPSCAYDLLKEVGVDAEKIAHLEYDTTDWLKL
jgi:hypothetical protein